MRGDINSAPAFQKNSFHRGQADYESIIGDSHTVLMLTSFRASLAKDIDILEKILTNISSIEEFISEKPQSTLLEFLNDDFLIKEAADKKNYEKISSQNRKKLGVESELQSLTDVEKSTLFSFDYGEIFIAARARFEKNTKMINPSIRFTRGSESNPRTRYHRHDSARRHPF